jgi:hypothetical protein
VDKVQTDERRGVGAVEVTAHCLPDCCPKCRHLVGLRNNLRAERPGEIPAFRRLFDKENYFGHGGLRVDHSVYNQTGQFSMLTMQ